MTKNKLIAIAFFVISPLFLAETVHSFETSGIPVVFSTPLETLKVLKLLLAIIAGISFCVPWFLYKKIKSYQPKRDLLIAKFNIGNPSLVLGYSFLFSPVIYGLLLFFIGMSISEFYYFAGVSSIGALAWGIYDFGRM